MIIGKEPLFKKGKVNFGGIIKEVSLAYVPEAVIGNYVIVHAGFAISKVDEDEAMKVFEYLKEMGELAELEAFMEISWEPWPAAQGTVP